MAKIEILLTYIRAGLNRSTLSRYFKTPTNIYSLIIINLFLVVVTICELVLLCIYFGHDYTAKKNKISYLINAKDGLIVQKITFKYYSVCVRVICDFLITIGLLPNNYTLNLNHKRHHFKFKNKPYELRYFLTSNPEIDKTYLDEPWCVNLVNATYKYCVPAPASSPSNPSTIEEILLENMLESDWEKNKDLIQELINKSKSV